MALQAIGGGAGGWLLTPGIRLQGNDAASPVATALNAVGESVAHIGQVFWSDGGSHDVSNAGGKIHWSAGTVTFASASSNLRVGLQPLGASGLETGTFDTYDDLVGGTDTITANSLQVTTMSSGTKTIAHGATVAVVFEMTARGGTDSVEVHRMTGSGGFPYSSSDTGSHAKSAASIPYCVIEADDGTLGILGGPHTIPALTSATSFNNGSTPDEYGSMFEVTFRCSVNKLFAALGDMDGTEAGELVLYSDPLGTPVAERTATVAPANHGQPGNASTDATTYAITEFTLEPNTPYAVTYRPTDAAGRLISRVVTIPSAGVRAFTPFGTTLQGVTRSDNTGAFTPSTTDWAQVGVHVNKLDDGAGGGGGGSSAAALIGGRLIR
jgi:hypothetical protein